MVSEEILKAAKKYIHLLNGDGFKINKAFLYGSYATGKATRSSDIDLMLISSYEIENDLEKKSRAWVLTRQVDSRIEPYIVSFERFANDDVSPVIEMVRREGIEIDFSN
ncbi:MAG: nucleotidyltransferase domain-containing protein [Bacteroidales bacterium]|nr:nucleotidyltransferase domain-containing protein [Bacteroidales bacterium]